MRVKDRQKRANEAFTKPLTTHLTRDKGDFSCRDDRASRARDRGRKSVWTSADRWRTETKDPFFESPGNFPYGENLFSF